MNVTTLFTQINAAFRGSDDDAPTTGTDFALWLATANRKLNEWSSDPINIWQSNFSYEKPNEPGTVSTTGSTTLTGSSTYFTDYNVGDTITVYGETVRTIASISSDTVLTVTVAFSNTNTGLTFTHTTILKSGTGSYSLHRNLIQPSDEALAVTTANGTVDLVIGKPQERGRYYNEVYLSGRNPQKLVFPDGIDSTNNTTLIGGTLKVPGYYRPADLVDGNSTVTIDDPYWLVYATASELAFNDITYSDKAADLNAKANNLYNNMVTANRRGTNNNPRVVQTNVQRILGTSSEAGVGSL